MRLKIEVGATRRVSELPIGALFLYQENLYTCIRHIGISQARDLRGGFNVSIDPGTVVETIVVDYSDEALAEHELDINRGGASPLSRQGTPN